MKMRHMKKEVFVCESCGIKSRLASAERHWCAECNLGAPIEMNPARYRGFAQISPTRITTFLPRLQRSY
ncbi:MAG: hypothetical protein QOI07_3519 [Verrucomicrobiota bacterium]|jgi:hypothetical protein